MTDCTVTMRARRLRAGRTDTG
ncbi:hypothetical protein ALC53_08624 [Atta colombica]|uniref:Uncharacterized protein n=1 Tax=Atta colombica TaxID=520822 RepID=A0A151I2D9_9HYME|nr:hypothetical protein ALC53_08624 [Atta colombica]